MNISTDQKRRLEEAARLAHRHSYSPYSRFPVGAAVLTTSGAIFSGCNVENASLGLTQCAERNAVAQAISQGERRILAIAVYTPTARPTPPCGACRQVLAEFSCDAIVLCVCDGDDRLETTLHDLLPDAFAANHTADGEES
ncbi:cytidine deaminase [Desulfuromonas sp. AOP6]|uniref:cytidine deaminase n=1 Tax=Desulfuromonas sp. AOP6 TaxID=1566351 RepID=UPI0012790491|nr:cytidine deaminase [Desulfuromonas sp. AOP6]BCA79269.1 cytidine deaminase [Desulfuromonas sp. AOP6]